MQLHSEFNGFLELDALNGEVVGYNNTAVVQNGTLEIPTAVNMVDVKRIGDYAFKDLQATHLVIYEGVESIGSGILEGSSVSSLVWANSIQNVAEDGLAGSNITELSIPHPLTVVGSQMLFADNGKLYHLEDLFMEIVRKVFPKSKGSFKGVNRSEEYEGYGDMFLTFTVSSKYGEFIDPTEQNSFTNAVSHVSKLLVQIMSYAYAIITNNTDINLGKALTLDEADSLGLKYDLEQGFIEGFKTGSRKQKSLELPSSIGGIIMTGVTAGAFSGSNIETVIIPNTYYDIGEEAFMHAGIVDLTVSGNIELVGLNAFAGNKIKYLNIPFANEIEKGMAPFGAPHLLGEMRKILMQEFRKQFNGCIFNYRVIETTDVEMHESEVENPETSVMYAHFLQIELPNNKLERTSKDIGYDISSAARTITNICFELASNRAHQLLSSQN